MKFRNNYLFFLVLLFWSNFLLAQNFEGTLIYKNDVEISKKFTEEFGINKESFLKKGGFFERSKLVYKDNQYIHVPIKGNLRIIYSPDRNELITLDKKTDFVSALRVDMDLESETTGSLPKIEIQDTDEVIMSRSCKKVIVTWKSGSYEYYYDSEFLKMDSKLYANHVYDMWSEYLKIANSLPLKIVKKTNNLMTFTMTLEKVKSHKVNKNIFKLPVLKPHKDLKVSKGNQRYYTID